MHRYLSMKLSVVVGVLLICSPVVLRGQDAPVTPDPVQEKAFKAPLEAERPLPDIPQLMHAVETNQRRAEEVRKNYIYDVTATQTELDKNGHEKKVTDEEREIFTVNGVRIARMLKKDGRELDEKEKKKEEERIEKEVEKARKKKDKADENGKETDSRGNDVINVSRILELGTFTNAQRVMLNERPTIVADYTGNPKVKTHNIGEAVIKDLVGRVWVDEEEKALVRGEGHFVDNFHVGGGLLVNLKKDSSFSFVNRRVNGEIWLPAQVDGKGSIRVLLFVNFNGSSHWEFSKYRKFKAKATILPGVGPVTEDGGVVPEGESKPK